MANKRKKTTAIVAGVTAAALLLGGTFAWTSISQQAKNEAAGIVNVGGRLHDDFDGKNKDVYVENFTDPLNGGQPIYARVKLTEYMEVGQDAGGTDDGDGKDEAVPVVEGTSIDNVDSWTPHIPETDCAVCETEGTCRIHSHWQWQMGGQTTYMPTFNKDKDSLKADTNGTYAGTNKDDKIYYDDYVEYTTDENGLKDIAQADIAAQDGKINSVIGTEYYDDDTDTEDNGGTRQVADVTHTAKETAEGSVITMDEWINTYNKAPGNYWVYDEDGWAYWANPIMPGEATGLLLDGIKMTKNPGEKCYYAINVVGQFATVNDWEYFYNENDEFDGTDEAKNLLETVSKNVATVTVTNVSGALLLTPGESYEFSANVYVNGAAMYAASDFEWSVLNADNTVSTTSTIENGVLTVGADETSKNLIVVAKAKDDAYLGALGMCSVAVDLPEEPVTFTVVDAEGKYLEVTDDEGVITVHAYEDIGEALTMTLHTGEKKVFSLGDNANADGISGTTLESASDTATDSAVLTIADGEAADHTWVYNGKRTFKLVDNVPYMYITVNMIDENGENSEPINILTKRITDFTVQYEHMSSYYDCNGTVWISAHDSITTTERYGPLVITASEPEKIVWEYVDYGDYFAENSFFKVTSHTLASGESTTITVSFGDVSKEIVLKP